MESALWPFVFRRPPVWKNSHDNRRQQAPEGNLRPGLRLLPGAGHAGPVLLLPRRSQLQPPGHGRTQDEQPDRHPRRLRGRRTRGPLRRCGMAVARLFRPGRGHALLPDVPAVLAAVGGGHPAGGAAAHLGSFRRPEPRPARHGHARRRVRRALLPCPAAADFRRLRFRARGRLPDPHRPAAARRHALPRRRGNGLVLGRHGSGPGGQGEAMVPDRPA